MQAGARVHDLAAQRDSGSPGATTGLGFLSRGVDLHMHRDLWGRGLRRDEVGAGRVEELGFLRGVDAGHAEEVGDLC